MEFLAFLSQLLLLALGVFLMIVILLQRGRGGGLAGAFGGLGGQSAFGTKAGDVFTKITVVIAVLWVLVSGSSGFLLRRVGEGTRAQELPTVEAGMRSAEEDPESETTELPVRGETSTPATTTESGDAAGEEATESPTDGGEGAAETPSGDATPDSDGADSETKSDDASTADDQPK